MKKVLLVEDNELNRRLFCDLLLILKVDVTTAENGTQALELLKEQTFDLILTDIYLPDISGIELTHKIRSDKSMAGIPVIAVTAAPRTKDAEEAFSEMDAVISKPIVVSDFMVTLTKFL